MGKGAARLTEQALQKAIQKFLEQKSKPAHGKQTMRQLMLADFMEAENGIVVNLHIQSIDHNEAIKTIKRKSPTLTV